ncbi:hypothetical protein N8I77_004437 [Diaporthe amygdali]|nr:hypothetical protein N8I77_004437 [Diaporthe amygdali]
MLSSPSLLLITRVHSPKSRMDFRCYPEPPDSLRRHLTPPQSRQMSENNRWSATLEKQMPRHLPSDRELELMKRLQVLEDMFKDLKGQVEAPTTQGPKMLQISEPHNFRQSQTANSHQVGSKRAVELTTINQEEQSQVTGKRRRLNYSKCTFCRKDKKTCDPFDRIWPGQKCQRCARMGLDCSANVTKKAGGEKRTSRAAQQDSSEKDPSGPNIEQHYLLSDSQAIRDRPWAPIYDHAIQGEATFQLSHEVANITGNKDVPQNWAAHDASNQDNGVEYRSATAQNDVPTVRERIRHTVMPSETEEDSTGDDRPSYETPWKRWPVPEPWDPWRNSGFGTFQGYDIFMNVDRKNPEISTGLAASQFDQRLMPDVQRQTQPSHAAHVPESAVAEKLVCPYCKVNVKTKSELKCPVQDCRKRDKDWPRADDFRQHLKRVHMIWSDDADLEKYVYK